MIISTHWFRRLATLFLLLVSYCSLYGKHRHAAIKTSYWASEYKGQKAYWSYEHSIAKI